MSKHDNLLIPAVNPRLTNLPTRFHTLRPNQIRAIAEILEHYAAGAKVVVLDAPTGSGKTLMAEVTRRMLGTRGNFVCSGKELQAQFARDFDAPILMGRSNYIPTSEPMGLTCDDCNWDGEECSLCEVRELCPYVVARDRAVRAPVAALNAHFWLATTQSNKSPWVRRGLTVIDEADTLEGVLMDQTEIYISASRAAKLNIFSPVKMTKEDAYLEWGLATVNRLRERMNQLGGTDLPPASPLHAKEWKWCGETWNKITAMIDDLGNGLPWVYTGGAGSERRRGDQISFKPVTVSRAGKEIWERDHKFLLMSGTVVSAQMLLEDLGWNDEYGYVKVESSFHPKNRQVVVRPVGDMSRKGQDRGGTRRVALAVEELVRQVDGRILVHAVSYGLSGTLAEHLRAARTGRDIFTYTSASTRAGAIESFRATQGAVLVAPSAERGIDLPDEACRAQIICKVPFPYLGDQQVSARMYAKNGSMWYQVQVARTVMQMVGRAVRHDQDYAVCYVLDSQFVKHWAGWKQLYPEWFRRSVRFERAG